ncbi:hypothetical protein BDR26DRAFT_913818 [Obelidium mucronatum]|nr:hypothetical protein BDR26DRAFT_913818 [Obelidium mucronatum]
MSSISKFHSAPAKLAVHNQVDLQSPLIAHLLQYLLPQEKPLIALTSKRGSYVFTDSGLIVVRITEAVEPRTYVHRFDFSSSERPIYDAKIETGSGIEGRDVVVSFQTTRGVEEISVQSKALAESLFRLVNELDREIVRNKQKLEVARDLMGKMVVGDDKDLLASIQGATEALLNGYRPTSYQSVYTRFQIMGSAPSKTQQQTHASSCTLAHEPFPPSLLKLLSPGEKPLVLFANLERSLLFTNFALVRVTADSRGTNTVTHFDLARHLIQDVNLLTRTSFIGVSFSIASSRNNVYQSYPSEAIEIWMDADDKKSGAVHQLFQTLNLIFNVQRHNREALRDIAEGPRNLDVAGLDAVVHVMKLAEHSVHKCPLSLEGAFITSGLLSGIGA